MPTPNNISVQLAKNHTTAKALVADMRRQQHTDFDRVSMSYIVQGRVLPTKDTLKAMTEKLGCETKDLYDLNDIDLTHTLDLVPEVDDDTIYNHRSPVITATSDRDRSGRIWMDTGSAEAKDRLLEQAQRHGYERWQQLLVLLETILNMLDAGMLNETKLHEIAKEAHNG